MDDESALAGCIVGRNEYGVYCVPRSARHRPASKAILSSRVWEPDTLDLLRGIDPRSDIVHAGAFFGDFIPALAGSRSAGALVWAFEPGSENHRCAEATVRLNELGNVVLTHAALDEEAGAASLATSDEEGLGLGGGSHILLDEMSSRVRCKERVELVTIDEIVSDDRHVGAIQLDVEGRESKALAGGMETIERCRPLLVLEGSPETFAWVIANLRRFGYALSGSVHRNIVLDCR